MASLAPSQYRQLVSSAHPGSIVILIDQSESMKDSANVVATAVSSVVHDIVAASRSAARVRDRCFVGIIGYGGEAIPLVSGLVSALPDNPVTPRAAGGRPMAQAMTAAADLIETHVAEYPDSFPPIVINITSGMPDDLQKMGDGEQTRAAAKRLLRLATTDGSALLFNVHIAMTNAGELILPTVLSSSTDAFAHFLFELSSPIPRQLAASAANARLEAHPGSRAFVFNATPENLVRVLAFASASLR